MQHLIEGLSVLGLVSAMSPDSFTAAHWLLAYLFVFVFGAVWGSFLNVVIYRLPVGKSILRPRRSFCPKCEHEIAWFDNIPILSFLLLKRRCRHCHEPISYRYVVVELLTAILFCLVFQRFGFSVATPIYWILTGCLIAITFIDIDHFIIPDSLSLGLLPVGLLVSLFAIQWGVFSGLHVTNPIQAVLALPALGQDRPRNDGNTADAEQNDEIIPGEIADGDEQAGGAGQRAIHLDEQARDARDHVG